MSFILDALKKSEENRTENYAPKAEKHILIPHLRTPKRGFLIAACILIPLLSLVFGWVIGNQPAQTAFQASGQVRALTNPITPARPVPLPAQHQKPEPRQTDPGQKAMATNQTAQQPLPKHVAAPVPQRHQPKEPLAAVKPQHVANPEPDAANVEGTKQTQDRVYFSDLPPALRREISPLNISLHFFSPDPSRRMLRINGKIRHENENITDQLSIAEIKEASTLFNYRGTLFELPVSGQ